MICTIKNNTRLERSNVSSQCAILLKKMGSQLRIQNFPYKGCNPIFCQFSGKKTLKSRTI